jgi:hypothetical protein
VIKEISVSTVSNRRKTRTRQAHTAQQNSMHSENVEKQSLLNFESKLEKDLQDTTQSLINQLKNHSLLSKQDIKMMDPVE